MNGILNIFKPKGMSSFDVVRVVKKVAKTGKVGHTGTLDPEATGVLPVCIGRATKIIDYIMDSEKVYEVTFKLGIRTTTYDLEGEVLEERDTSNLSDKDILGVIKEFIGEYSQVPPMYSALKQNGVRLYELARKGIEVEREGRLISIYNIENIKIDNPYISMTVTCSKGTYIRSLCYDIGEKLGVFATMTELNRSKTSVFSQENSININDLTEENIDNYIVTMEKALSKYESITAHGKYVKLLINGVRVADNRFTKDKVMNNVLYRVYDENKNFIGLGKKNNFGFKIEKLLMV
ncbi:tRNA pseudouridine(55) synthase TruB [Clostridium sp.]|jgi:tRNA pseudouridine55 synthase|uniref:tRNA pseudouridine(55) synthase TruB n=1 Tax=Clostridium sp. TaxID=1506 RepID=UPI0025B89851|nr:tRNA pseudouridine(55) synthase TruB [Clostridium sp.]MCI9070124.1 tRNA pseudouridine(55) synthase TruB [Clostridium sp.]